FFSFQTLLLCVVLSSREARRVQLSEVPGSVAELIDELIGKLELDGDFYLQFEDPAERAVLHIMWNCDSSAPHQSSNSSICSVSSIDTASPAIRIPSGAISISGWPTPFPIPKFSYDVELKLRKGNEAYEKSKKGIDVTRDMKMDILDKLAQAIIEFKSYPEKEELESVASLVLKYPCQKEPGSSKGYDGWKTSIKYKLGNYSSKLRHAGCNEVNVNRKRKGGDEDDTSFTLKRPKRGEVNHVTDYPQHHDDSTLEEERVALVDEMKKKNNTL
uniref:Uncharacterized protein n=1 Tax=Gasterosteus aculeatus TaxID=69293 RepID=G3PMD1_GASAC